MLVSNAGGDNYKEFIASYREAFEMELDELEDLMRVRNALADKARDEMESKR